MEIIKQETKKVLDHFVTLGFDLSKEMEIDFFIEGEKDDLQHVESDICKLLSNNCRTSIEYDDEFDIWTCYTSIKVVPELSKIVSIENKFLEIALKNNCSYEGFGSFGN